MSSIPEAQLKLTGEEIYHIYTHMGEPVKQGKATLEAKTKDKADVCFSLYQQKRSILSIAARNEAEGLVRRTGEFRREHLSGEGVPVRQSGAASRREGIHHPLHVPRVRRPRPEVRLQVRRLPIIRWSCTDEGHQQESKRAEGGTADRLPLQGGSGRQGAS